MWKILLLFDKLENTYLALYVLLRNKSSKPAQHHVYLCPIFFRHHVLSRPIVLTEHMRSFYVAIVPVTGWNSAEPFHWHTHRNMLTKQFCKWYLRPDESHLEHPSFGWTRTRSADAQLFKCEPQHFSKYCCPLSIWKTRFFSPLTGYFDHRRSQWNTALLMLPLFPLVTNILIWR